jgi:Bacterial inner membrane protein
MNTEYFANGIGYAGVVANILWPLMRSRSKLLVGQVVACVLMLTHFYMLGALSGAAVMAVAGLQALLAIPLGRHPRFRYVYLASLFLTPAVCIATWHGPESMFSSIAMGVFCLANFQLNQVRQRALLIVVIFAWYAHNFIAWSVPGLVSNTLALLVSARMLVIVYKASRQSIQSNGHVQRAGA